METQLAPQELEIDKIEAITRNLKDGDSDDKEFEKRLRIAEIALKESELSDKRTLAESNKKSEQALLDSLVSDRPSSPPQEPSRPVGPRGPNVGPAPEVA
jgi:hypothetical protein